MGLLTSKRSASKTFRSRRRVSVLRQSNSQLLTESTDRLINLMANGIPISALTALSDTAGIPIPELASTLRIPARTLARRRVTGRLNADESERFVRLLNIFEKAVRLFEGQVGPAITWLKSPKKALSNHSPLEYASFEISGREVENLIGRLEHGVFS